MESANRPVTVVPARHRQASAVGKDKQFGHHRRGVAVRGRPRGRWFFAPQPAGTIAATAARTATREGREPAAAAGRVTILGDRVVSCWYRVAVGVTSGLRGHGRGWVAGQVPGRWSSPSIGWRQESC